MLRYRIFGKDVTEKYGKLMIKRWRRFPRYSSSKGRKGADKKQNRSGNNSKTDKEG